MMTVDQTLADVECNVWAHSRFLSNVDQDRNGLCQLLQRLGETDFQQSDAQVEASRILADPSYRPEWLSQRGKELLLTASINEFATKLFTIPIPERQQRWTELNSLVEEFPALKRWTQQLSPGLKLIAIPECEDPSISQLIDKIRAGFTAPYPDSIRLRQDVIAQLYQQPKWMEQAIRYLKSKHPDFLQSLAPWLITRHRALTNRQPVWKHIEKIKARNQRGLNAQVSPGYAIWIIIVVAIGIGRGLMSSGPPARFNQQPLPIPQNWAPPPAARSFEPQSSQFPGAVPGKSPLTNLPPVVPNQYVPPQRPNPINSPAPTLPQSRGFPVPNPRPTPGRIVPGPQPSRFGGPQPGPVMPSGPGRR